MEPRAHILADLVAAGANRRPDADDQVIQPAAELASQPFNGNGRDRQRQAAPTGMSRRNGSGPPIGDEQRQTIGGLDRQRHVAGVRQNNVRLAARRAAVRRRVSISMNDRCRPVHLSDKNQIQRTNRRRLRHLVPCFVRRYRRRPEFPAARGEKMRGVGFERPAYQRWSGR